MQSGLVSNSFSQKVLIDPGHGWGINCSNPDGRLSIEMETAYETGLKLKNKLTSSCTNLSVQMTRNSNGCNSWISLSQRTSMANSWGADVFLSIHTNGGGGTGTETYWCDLSPSSNSVDRNFCNQVQNEMVNKGSWVSRRSVEDNSFLNFHLYVLRYSSMTSVLNEIGFGDNTNDYAKLASDSWRDKFAEAYYNAITSFLIVSCSTPALPTPCGVSKTINCGDIINDSTTNGSSNMNNYSCVGLNEYGKEKIYKINITDTSNFTANLLNNSVNLDLFLLTDSCNPNSCIEYAYINLAKDSLLPGTYYLVVDGQGTSSSAQDGTFTLEIGCNPINNSASIEDNNIKDEILIYPNPTTNFVTIEFNESKEKNYIVSNYLGEIIEQGTVNNKETLNFTNLPKGTYIISILEKEKRIITKRIVKLRNS